MTQINSLVLQDVLLVFAVVFIANLIVGIKLCCLFFRHPINQNLSENESLKNSHKTRKIIGVVIVIFIVFIGTIAVTFAELNMNPNQSILWFIWLFIAFLFDFFFIQLLKVLIYYCSFEGIILPSS